jgi:hypothetical protein
MAWVKIGLNEMSNLVSLSFKTETSYCADIKSLPKGYPIAAGTRKINIPGPFKKQLIKYIILN